MSVIMLPVVFELKFDKDGTIIPGPGTKQACDKTLAAARATPRARILLTAIEPPHPKWNEVTMASVCERYLRSQNPKCKLIMRRAPAFNTDGEIAALFRYLEESTAERAEVHVKWWHAPRTRLLIKKHAATSTWQGEVKVIPHRLPLWVDLKSTGAILLESIKIPRTWVQVQRQKTRGQH